MVQSLAPRLSRGCWRVILSIALAGLWPCALAAQAPETKKDAPPAKKDAGKADSKAAPKDAPVDSNVTLQQILAMAAGADAINREAIQQWVGGQAANLTNHNNLTALINPGPAVKPGAVSRAIHEASQALIEPLTASKEGSQFR